MGKRRSGSFHQSLGYFFLMSNVDKDVKINLSRGPETTPFRDRYRLMTSLPVTSRLSQRADALPQTSRCIICRVTV